MTPLRQQRDLHNGSLHNHTSRLLFLPSSSRLNLQDHRGKHYNIVKSYPGHVVVKSHKCLLEPPYGWYVLQVPWHKVRSAHKSTEVVRERVQDGLTGETRDMQYTQCKIIGNGSFGVVFQTKLAPTGEDAAIKRVLQDKRFKVCWASCNGPNRANLDRTANCKSCASCAIPTLFNSRLSTIPTATGYVNHLRER